MPLVKNSSKSFLQVMTSSSSSLAAFLVLLVITPVTRGSSPRRSVIDYIPSFSADEIFLPPSSHLDQSRLLFPIPRDVLFDDADGEGDDISRPIDFKTISILPPLHNGEEQRVVFRHTYSMPPDVPPKVEAKKSEEGEREESGRRSVQEVAETDEENDVAAERRKEDGPKGDEAEGERSRWQGEDVDGHEALGGFEKRVRSASMSAFSPSHAYHPPPSHFDFFPRDYAVDDNASEEEEEEEEEMRRRSLLMEATASSFPASMFAAGVIFASSFMFSVLSHYIVDRQALNEDEREEEEEEERQANISSEVKLGQSAEAKKAAASSATQLLW